VAIRCRDCWTKVEYLGRDRKYGGELIKCPDCGTQWSMGQSMTGPEACFMPLDKDGEFTGDYGCSNAPVDTLNPNCIFYLALIAIIVATYFLR